MPRLAGAVGRQLAKSGAALAMWMSVVYVMAQSLGRSPLTLGAFWAEMTSARWEYLGKAGVLLVGQVVIAFLLGSVASAVVAWVAAVKFPAMRQFVVGFGIMLKATPVVILLPWLHNLQVPYLLISEYPGLFGGLLVSFFPTLVEAVTGLAAAPTELVRYYRSIVGLPERVILGMKIRYGLKYLFPALKVSFVLSVVGCVVGETVVPTQGSLGEIVTRGTNYTDYNLQFIALAMCSAVALVGYGAVEAVHQVACWWEDGNAAD